MSLAPEQLLAREQKAETPSIIDPASRYTRKLSLYLSIRRVAEFIACVVAIILLSPLLVLVSLAIKLDSPGPVIFSQSRLGKNKAPFVIFKFRTMRVDAPQVSTAEMANLPDMVTRVGRFLRRTSIDEIPQFLNVAKGEMSIIGPRPTIDSQQEIIEIRTRNHIYELTPGITGWAQINGRDSISAERIALHDAFYLENLGMSLDFKILYRTVRVVLSGNGYF